MTICWFFYPLFQQTKTILLDFSCLSVLLFDPDNIFNTIFIFQCYFNDLFVCVLVKLNAEEAVWLL